MEKVCRRCGQKYPENVRFCMVDGLPLVADGGSVDPFIGKILGDRYEIVEPIGKGGMAKVYLARHRMIDRTFAVKMLRPDLDPDSRSVERFRQEAKAAGRIDHPNVVVPTDFGETEDGLLYMVMEHVSGPSLSKLIHIRESLAPMRVVRFGTHVAKALECAHQHDVVHRDLKPENIMIIDEGSIEEQAKVLDFGIAKILGIDSPNPLTRAGMVFGTPEYMSPEQAMGMKLDGRTDLYSLGCVLYECLSGFCPIQGNTNSETLVKQVKELPIPILQRAPDAGIDPLLAEVVMRLLEKNREDRFATAKDTWQALEAAGKRQLGQNSSSLHSQATELFDTTPMVDDDLLRLGETHDDDTHDAPTVHLTAEPNPQGEPEPDPDQEAPGQTGGNSESNSQAQSFTDNVASATNFPEPSSKPEIYADLTSEDLQHRHKRLVRRRRKVVMELVECTWTSQERPAHISRCLDLLGNAEELRRAKEAKTMALGSIPAEPKAKGGFISRLFGKKLAAIPSANLGVEEAQVELETARLTMLALIAVGRHHGEKTRKTFENALDLQQTLLEMDVIRSELGRRLACLTQS